MSRYEIWRQTSLFAHCCATSEGHCSDRKWCWNGKGKRRVINVTNAVQRFVARPKHDDIYITWCGNAAYGTTPVWSRKITSPLPIDGRILWRSRDPTSEKTITGYLLESAVAVCASCAGMALFLKEQSDVIRRTQRSVRMTCACMYHKTHRYQASNVSTVFFL